MYLFNLMMMRRKCSCRTFAVSVDVGHSRECCCWCLFRAVSVVALAFGNYTHGKTWTTKLTTKIQQLQSRQPAPTLTARGTGSVGDAVGEGTQRRDRPSSNNKHTVTPLQMAQNTSSIHQRAQNTSSITEHILHHRTRPPSSSVFSSFSSARTGLTRAGARNTGARNMQTCFRAQDNTPGQPRVTLRY